MNDVAVPLSAIQSLAPKLVVTSFNAEPASVILKCANMTGPEVSQALAGLVEKDRLSLMNLLAENVSDF